MPEDGRPVSNNLIDLAPPDIAWFQERSDIVLIPIGSLEQHGAHLPLGTDTITALEVSRRAAAKADVPYTPPFWAGYSPQHLRDTEASVGTVTLRASTLNEVLYDIARSLIHHGWNKLIFVNGHGSNTKVLDPLLRRIKYETGAFVALYKPYAERYIGMLDGLLENPPDETPGWHASELETSQVMAHNPEPRAHGPRRAGPRAGPAVAARQLHQEGRRPGRRVRRLPVLRLPHGPRRVLADGRHRQPDDGDRREGRGGPGAIRRSPREGHRRVPPARGHRDPEGVRGPRLSSVPPALRRAQILERIQRDGGVSVADLARDHAVSPITVHRDLEQLSREGLVERVHGGARALRGTGTLPLIATAWTQRVEQEAAAKAAIAAHVATMVTSGSTVFLDASSTALALARRLMEDPPNELTLVTNSPAIAYEVIAEPMHVVVCPGELDQHMRMIAGRWTVEFLHELNFDMAFVSAAGLTIDAGLTTSRRPLADVVNAARAVAGRTVGMIDATKFGRASLVSIAPAQELELIVTDDGLEEAVAEEYRAAAVRLEIVEKWGGTS